MKRSASRDSPPRSKRRYDDSSDERMTPERVRGLIARSSSPRSRYISPHRDEYIRTREIPPERNSYKVLCVSALHPKASDEFIKETLYREFKKFGEFTIRISPNPDDRVAYICFRTFEDAQKAKHANPRIILYNKAASIEPIYESPRIESRSRSITPEPPKFDRYNYSHLPEPERHRSIHHSPKPERHRSIHHSPEPERHRSIHHSPKPERHRSIHHSPEPYNRYEPPHEVMHYPREFTAMNHDAFVPRESPMNHTTIHSGPSQRGSTINASMGSDSTLLNEAANITMKNMTQIKRIHDSQAGVEQEQPPRIRKFTTAQRKHLRRLLDSGKSYEEAAAQVLGKPKRRNNNPIPLQNKSSKITLIHRDHPFYMLSRDQMNALELAVSEEIDKIPDNGPRIQFRNWVINSGMVVVDCTEEASVQWLMGIVARKKLVQGVNIIAVNGNNVPKTATCMIWIPATDKTSPSSILARIRKQNDVNTERWNVLKVDADEKGRTIVLSIDETSLNKLKKMNMRVFYLVKQLEIRVRTSSRQPRP